jgi:hypothetical protein
VQSLLLFRSTLWVFRRRLSQGLPASASSSLLVGYRRLSRLCSRRRELGAGCYAWIRELVRIEASRKGSSKSSECNLQKSVEYCSANEGNQSTCMCFAGPRTLGIAVAECRAIGYILRADLDLGPIHRSDCRVSSYGIAVQIRLYGIKSLHHNDRRVASEDSENECEDEVKYRCVHEVPVCALSEHICNKEDVEYDCNADLVRSSAAERFQIEHIIIYAGQPERNTTLNKGMEILRCFFLTCRMLIGDRPYRRQVIKHDMVGFPRLRLKGRFPSEDEDGASDVKCAEDRLNDP